MKRHIFLVLILLASLHTLAVGPDTTRKPNHADSLRGFLGPLRSCYDIRFYHLDIKIDPETKYISGNNTITFTVVTPMADMQLDLFANMKIDSILYGKARLSYKRDGNAVFVHFPKKLKSLENIRIVFWYSGKPVKAKNAPWDGGFTWTHDTLGRPWAAVSCQGTGASLWWPNKDHQSDEPDSMLISIHVPNGLQNISNGRLLRAYPDKDGYTGFDWFVKNPINNYDVTVNIGHFAHFSDHFNYLTLDFYVLPEYLSQAKKQFTQAKTMLACFTKYFGPYPFPEDGYKLVQSPYLGMEHQSAIAYGNHFTNGYLGTDLSDSGLGLSWDYIIVHESAHEWFGNNITTNDIADSWVHESFATYAESLYVEYLYGYEKGQRYLLGMRKKIENTESCIPLYGVNQDGPLDIYYKGANILNTVRHIISNDSTWFHILKGLNQTFRHKTVDGSQIINYISTESGLNLSKVFEQYLHYAAIPRLEYRFTIDGHQIQYKWITDVRDFEMPARFIVGKQVFAVSPESSGWKTLTIPKNINSDQVKIDTDTYYITTQKD